MNMQTSTDYYFDKIMNDYEMYATLERRFSASNFALFASEVIAYTSEHKELPEGIDSDPLSLLIGELYKRFNDIVYGVVYDSPPGYPDKPVTLSEANRYRYDTIMADAKTRKELQHAYETASPKVFVDFLTKLTHDVKLPKGMSPHGRWMQLFRAFMYKFDTGTDPLNLTPEDRRYHIMMADEARIETRTYINGKNGADMNDDEIFEFIAHLESEAEKLSKIQTNSTKVASRIEQLRNDAMNLAAYLDDR